MSGARVATKYASFPFSETANTCKASALYQTVFMCLNGFLLPLSPIAFIVHHDVMHSLTNVYANGSDITSNCNLAELGFVPFFLKGLSNMH